MAAAAKTFAEKYQFSATSFWNPIIFVDEIRLRYIYIFSSIEVAGTDLIHSYL